MSSEGTQPPSPEDITPELLERYIATVEQEESHHPKTPKDGEVSVDTIIHDECVQRGKAILALVTGAVEKAEQDPNARMPRLRKGVPHKEKLRPVDIDFGEEISTGDPQVPMVTMKDLLISTMSHRLTDVSFTGRRSDDVPFIYDLLKRWLDRRALAVQLEKTEISADSPDVELWPAVTGAIRGFQRLHEVAKQYPGEDLSELIETGDPERPFMVKGYLVAATLFRKAQHNRDMGKVLKMDEEQVHRCFEKVEQFMEWMAGAKQIALVREASKKQQ